MISSPTNNHIFEQFAISPQRGFLPTYTPLLSLGVGYEKWDAIVPKLPHILKGQTLSEHIEALPPFDLSNLDSPNKIERGFLILAHLANGYVWETGEMRTAIPAKIALPFAALAKKLGRPAIVHHMSNVMYNWKKIDPSGELVAENMQALIGFDGSSDEAWFYNVTAEIEAVGAPALKEMIHLALNGATLREEEILACINTLSSTAEKMINSLNKMPQGCSPDRFYHHIRPYLASFVDVTYEGVNEQPLRSYAGGSAAQSSLIQAYDIALGIKHPHESGKYLLKMREHMPPSHKSFLEWLEAHLEVKKLVWGKAKLEAAYESLSQRLLTFRNTHLKIVARYIVAPAKASGMSAEGTGGTDALTFLKEVRNDMKEG